MKANAPEKIYLDIEPNLDDCTWHLTNPNGDSIEYTRTDAFIEKACEWIRDNYLKYPSEDCADITKFVTDFKNYINL